MNSATLKKTLIALPGVGISLLPKLMCPACWPAYAGIVSALGCRQHYAIARRRRQSEFRSGR